MSKIVDQYGKPIDQGTLNEPQTAHITNLQNQYLTPMLSGLTPARLARVLQEADNGNLLEQHRLFADMEERDGHIQAEMDKRKTAIVGLSWDIVPPRNATAAEKASAQWVKEVLQDAADPMENLCLAMMDAVGHGFAPVELEWRREGSTLLPDFYPRPQEWFKLNQARTEIRLNDGSADGEMMRPFGWIMHTRREAKTGYAARMGLFRTLVWPFLYKAYALGDFAEFLETYGLPIIVGKYFAGATAEEKASLMRAVTQLSHDARAIMPEEMKLEIQKITGGAGESAHLAMMNWADKSQSKSILGQTLSADTGKGGGGSYALGKVHNEVRHDIRNGDARQAAATLTRDLVYPLLALNRPGTLSLARCPRLAFDLGEAEDLTSYAEALPKLAGAGLQIPVNWAHERLHIPQPQDGEAVLKPLTAAPVSNTAPGDPAPTAELTRRVPVATAALSTDDLTDTLAAGAAPSWASHLERIAQLVEQATSLAELQSQLLNAYGGSQFEQLVKLMAAGFALAELKGMSDAQEER
ncbi:DUF935 family protein [Duganella sp. FT50W]|uniref:DUF935 family protein n=1 Tax=Duganella lactea TaxID=2692173 RepID=A0A6L8ME74_9BURK|nr:DUF935 domain-containing protein [Duganella lactea]MYM80549.1 DUF935 family protein [Duganella lactea]